MRTIFTFYLVLVDIIGNVRIFARRRKLSFRVIHFNIFILNILIIYVNIFVERSFLEIKINIDRKISVFYLIISS